MPNNGANKKGASDLAAALASKSATVEQVLIAVDKLVEDIEDSDIETLAEVLNSDPPDIASKVFNAEELAAFREWQAKQQEKGKEPEKPSGPILMQMYDILADHITGASPHAEQQNVEILKGRVTSADLDAAQVDKEWLLRTGAIAEAGWFESGE